MSKTTIIINIKDIRSIIYTINDYAILDINIPSEANSNNIKSYIRYKVYLVNDLKAKILIGIDITSLEKIYIDLSTKNQRLGVTTS